jgi:hypothetical protein
MNVFTVDIHARKPMAFHARWMDIHLVGKTRVSLVGAPQSSPGLGGPSVKQRSVEELIGCPDTLNGNERAWIRGTVARYYRDYCRTLALLFPNMEARVVDFTFSCETVPTTIKWLKSLCQCPMTRLIQRQGGWDLPFTGGPRRYLQRLLGRVNKKSLLFANTALQLKRVALEVPQSFVSSQLEAHKERMTMPHRQSLSFIGHVARCALSFTGNYEWTPKGENRVRDSSLNSCVESTRLTGGVYGYFYGGEKHPLRKLLEYGEGDVTWDELWQAMQPVQEIPSASLYSRVPGTPLDGLTDEFAGYESNQRIPFAWCRPYVWDFRVSDTKISYQYQRLPPTIDQLVQLHYESTDFLAMMPRRDIVAICEPLKVRVISKHHAWESPLWSGFQKSLTRYLSKQKYFLVGEEFSYESFEGLEESLEWYRQNYGSAVIVSDDATAATDSISNVLSERVMLPLIPECLQELCSSSFLGKLYYPGQIEKQKGGCGSGNDQCECLSCLDTQVIVDQTTGQLMGDRRSFPLLCLIHAGTKRLFLERKGVPRENQCFFVNGDDGVIVLPRDWVQEYFTFVNELWELNPLKSYVHERIFSFNSTFFQLGKGQLPIFRWNLISAFATRGGKTIDPTCWNEVAESAPGYADELWKFFIGSPAWRETLAYLDRRANGNNWFVPRVCGGYGLRRFTETDLGEGFKARKDLEVHLHPNQARAILQTILCFGSGHDAPDFQTRRVAIKGGKFSYEQAGQSCLVPKIFTETRAAPQSNSVKTVDIGTKLLVAQLPIGSETVSMEIPEILWTLRVDNEIPL